MTFYFSNVSHQTVQDVPGACKKPLIYNNYECTCSYHRLYQKKKKKKDF